MISINLLIRDFSLNSRGFLFPILYNKARLRERGLEVRLFRKVIPELLECDVLAIDSKHHRDKWVPFGDLVLEELQTFRDSVDRVLFFDTGDSTGGVLPQVLPFVDAYCKAQLLKDRERYLKPMYAKRLFADFYHRHYGVQDDDPEWSEPVGASELLAKLRVSWNTALGSYGLWGLTLMKAYRRLPIRALLRYPRRFEPPRIDRPEDIFCRMQTAYRHRSVGYQRSEIARMEICRGSTDKLGRRRYLAELRDHKAVISPFGYGEITLKDFEVFLCGALLIKPDMSAIETYPDLFRNAETMVAHSWRLDDLPSCIDRILASYSDFIELARRGQELYRHHLVTPEGHDEFVGHFERLVTGKS